MDKTLKPTLWRTCRALANARRLRILERLCTAGEQCVSQVAVACGVSVVQATQHLRGLQARGLLRVRRSSRWVFYTAAADPLVTQAAPALAAVRAAFARGDGVRDLQAAFTAFTHERRIRIACALAAGPADVAALRARTGISAPALQRHLRKLRRRGVIDADDRDRLRLARLAPGLLRDVVRLALAEGA